MKRLYLSAETRQDLAGIWFYSFETWGQDQADRYSAALHALFGRIVAGSVASRPAESTRPDLRKVPIGRHMVFFRESADAVEVVRVLHEKMDVGRVYCGV